MPKIVLWFRYFRICYLRHYWLLFNVKFAQSSQQRPQMYAHRDEKGQKVIIHDRNGFEELNQNELGKRNG